MCMNHPVCSTIPWCPHSLSWISIQPPRQQIHTGNTSQQTSEGRRCILELNTCIEKVQRFSCRNALYRHQPNSAVCFTSKVVINISSNGCTSWQLVHHPCFPEGDLKAVVCIFEKLVGRNTSMLGFDGT